MRHSEITEHFTGNIKQSRAAVTKEVIDKYFVDLQEEQDDILPQLIYNYVKTNLSDDPGKKKCLMKRGTK